MPHDQDHAQPPVRLSIVVPAKLYVDLATHVVTRRTTRQQFALDAIREKLARDTAKRRKTAPAH